MKSLKILFTFLVGLILYASFGSTNVSASHSWGSYHWARTSNPFNLKLGDNLSTSWDPYLSTSSADWSVSSILDTAIVPGKTSANRCRPTNGRVEACNYRYGKNGWLGIAQIWINGNHIYQGIVKTNDTYFSSPAYNTPAWKNLVMCQEVAHTFGLDHQDEIFDNPPLGTCMDYSNDPIPNQHPNQHDYDQLELIYAHLDTTTTVSQILKGANLSDIELPNRSDWGKLLKSKGRVALFERDFGSGRKVFTHVIWAEETQ